MLHKDLNLKKRSFISKR